MKRSPAGGRYSRTAVTVGLLLLGATLLAGAQDLDSAFAYDSSFTVTFHDENDGQWTWGNAADRILHRGGNPKDYLNNDYLDTIGPHARTSWDVESTFLGDYRAMGVVGMSADLLLNYVGYTALGRPVTLVLHFNNGTPADYSDDLRVYNKGRMFNTQVWTTYSFNLPAYSEVLPTGWEVWPGSGLADDEVWNIVVQHVDRVGFMICDPMMFYIFQMWDLGLDNPTIYFGEAPVTPGPQGPKAIDLAAAPNPFNPRTELSFRLEEAGSGSLAVFDVRGQRVAVLHEGALAAGENRFVWNGSDQTGRGLPSGVYFARLSVDGQAFTRKLLLNR